MFLAGYALGQLPYGALSNRFGRKPALYIAVLLAGTGACLCIISAMIDSFLLLLIGRVFMAFGSCAGLTMTFNIITDCYSGEKSRQITSYTMLAFAIMPGISIMIGGFLVSHFSWVSCFYFLLAYSIIIFLIVRSMPETSNIRDKSALRLQILKNEYLAAIKNKNLIICALMAGCATAFTYVFTTKAPFIAVQSIHLTPAIYGLYNIIPSLGMLIGSLLCAKLTKFQDEFTTIRWGLSIICLGMLIMLFAFLMNYISTNSLIFPMPIVNIGLVFVYTNVVLQGISHAKNRAVSSSVLSCINIGICFLSITILKEIPWKTPIVLPLSFLALLLCISILFIAHNKARRKGLL